ncbi:unnamed protein product [Sphagnum troendelagicum]|uniref:Histone chaperone domain-containing protein n=1 Tax=Sphagnum troendelagicum TaxID=128251 RepID=A0ABP0UEH6_9BRYO
MALGEEDESVSDLPSSLGRALEARSSDLRKQADTLTLPGVRRLLEKDLQLKPHHLDAHKLLVKQLVDKLKILEKEKPKVESGKDGQELSKRLKVSEHRDNSNKDDVPTKAGVEEGRDEDGARSEKKQGAEGLTSEDEVDMEALILSAVQQRSSEFRSQAESVTLSLVRRQLEQDLALNEGALDPYKQYIRKLVDELMSKEEEEAVIEKKEKVPDVEIVEVKPRKRKVADVDVVEKKPRMEKLGSVEMSEKKPKKGKVANVEIKEGRGGAKHKQKVSKMISRQKVVSSSDNENSSGESEDNKKLDDEEPAAEIDESDDGSSFKKTLKTKKAVDVKPTYGKKVEQMKNIIKACGMAVPPIIYRKVKQAPEPEKEAILIRELEAILNREGLSVHASKEEIRSVRKRKEKLKDLEGIDTSNIIVESRGRRAAAANFFAPKYTEVADMSDEDGQESSDSEDPDVDPLGADHEEDD